MKAKIDPLAVVPGIGPDVRRGMEAYGFETVEDVRQASEEELLEVPGIGEQKVEFLEVYLNEG